MDHQIVELDPKLLVGISLRMSLLQNRTTELWKQFIPGLKEISGPTKPTLYSLKVYNPDYFTLFQPQNEFEKWALVERSSDAIVPEGMKQFQLNGGTYAVFRYKGIDTSDAPFRYIYSEWLPESPYILDHRPHFEILGELYRHGSTESEEDIYIPIKHKMR